MIHNANSVRPKRDGLKVGGHQASASSMVTILTALYCGFISPNDRIAVKPHASPVFHSLQYLLGNQTVDQLQRFRSFGGIQSYPSRTKDQTDVDFSTGSVGLGAAITTFSAYTQDWLRLKGITPKQLDDSVGRTIALVGDAELDEGNVYEALVEAYKLNMQNNWWIVDYNRQSLDKVSNDSSYRQIDRMFRSTGWRVITVKYGKKLMQLFSLPGGQALRRWVRTCDNDLFGALVFKGGKAFRAQILKDIGNEVGVADTLSKYDDDALFETITNLGGHCFETLLDAFLEASRSSQRTAFICYTVKGYGLPLAGHRDNHGLFMNSKQVDILRNVHGIPEGEEWGTTAGLSDDDRKAAMSVLHGSALNELKTTYSTLVSQKGYRDFSHLADVYEIPDQFYENTEKGAVSTQTGFGHIMLAIGKSAMEFASRVMTVSPDVATSTNLTGFVNNRGVFGLETIEDTSKKNQVMSMNKWSISPAGQHVELGIAEHNLFLMLAAAGMSAYTYGQRVLPIGTLYDPFILRGLDALIYGCYQDSRFMVVATPSGISLAPEGGAHQSINTPLVGLSQPGLVYFEPTYTDELQVIVSWGLKYMQAPAGEGGSIYLRLSTRSLDQPDREMTSALREDIIRGAYFSGSPPSSLTKLCIVYMGAIAPEATAAAVEIQEKYNDTHGTVSLLHVTSPDVLYKDHQQNLASGNSHIRSLLSQLPQDCAILTVLDGHPLTLSWVGSVLGHRVHALGISKFGQSGDVDDLYDAYGISKDSIVENALNLLPARR